MQPALLVTAHPAKRARKRKPEAEKAVTKKALDKERSRTESTSVWPLSGGDNWGMWRAWKVMQRLLSFCWTGNYLFCFKGFVIFMKYVRFANLATFVARISPMLTLASAALQLPSGFAPPSGNPHWFRFESATVQDGRQLASRCVLVSTLNVLFWKVTGCSLLFWHLTSCLLCAKFSWISPSCFGISSSLLSPTNRCAFKFVGAWLWTEHWRGGGRET